MIFPTVLAISARGECFFNSAVTARPPDGNTCPFPLARSRLQVLNAYSTTAFERIWRIVRTANSQVPQALRAPRGVLNRRRNWDGGAVGRRARKPNVRCPCRARWSVFLARSGRSVESRSRQQPFEGGRATRDRESALCDFPKALIRPIVSRRVAPSARWAARHSVRSACNPGSCA